MKKKNSFLPLIRTNFFSFFFFFLSKRNWFLRGLCTQQTRRLIGVHLFVVSKCGLYIVSAKCSRSTQFRWNSFFCLWRKNGVTHLTTCYTRISWHKRTVRLLSLFFCTSTFNRLACWFAFYLIASYREMVDFPIRCGECNATKVDQ